MNKQNQWRRPDLHPAAKFFLLQEISLPFSFLQNIPYLNSITTLLLQKNCQIKILLPTLCVVLFSFAFSSMFGFFFLSNFFSCLSNPPTLLAFVSISCPWRQPWYFYISPLKQEMFKILCNGRSFEITMCHFSVRLYKRYANNFLSLKTSTFPIILWKFCIMRDNIYILIQKSGEYFFGLAFIFRPRFGAVISCI